MNRFLKLPGFPLCIYLIQGYPAGRPLATSKEKAR